MSDATRTPLAAATALACVTAVTTWAALALVGFGPSLLAGNAEPLLASIDFNAALFEDLLGPYWRTAETLHAGGTTPDAQYLYPATLAVLLAPLTALGPEAATAVAVGSAAVTLVALALACLLACPAASRRAAALLGLVLGLAFPLAHGAYWANAGAPCTAAGLLGWVLVHRERARAGAVLIGAAAAIKLTPLVLVVGLALARRPRVALEATAVAALLGIALPLAVLGPGPWLDFHRAAAEQLEALRALTSTPEGARGAQDLLSVVIRHADGPAGRAAAGLLLVGAALLALRAARRGTALAGVWLLALPCLAVRPCWAHGLVWLPLVWWTARVGGAPRRALAVLSLAAASIPATWAFPNPTEYLRSALLLVAVLLGLGSLAFPGKDPEPRP